MQSSEIREKFLRFFENKGHKILPGSSLVPADPTVLLTLAGMLQFKPIFLGQEKPAFKRAATVQKCMRMNDLDQVGRTPRHHTFFEMLGNFSFGDYFKKEAIQFAWELLVKELKLPVTKLKIAIYEKDDEAFDIWHKEIGLPKEIIYRLGEENNFWAAGPTGPCGPCSEIYFDLGEAQGCGKPACSPGCDCDRFLEVWNLVFIQYNRNEKGALIPLKQKGIDTGMGLERITAVLQGVADNFATDLFVPLINKIRACAGNGGAASPSCRIVADHIRAITHLIGDGVYPDNNGRGYVVRRLIRRAIMHGKLTGINEPFLSQLANDVVNLMGTAYPQLVEKREEIAKIILAEEKHFFSTLEQGMGWFEEIAMAHAADKLISGQTAFKLHDTYGFPIELTAELSAARGLTVDVAGFEKEMENQKERARRAGIKQEKVNLTSLDLGALPATSFTGYESSAEEAKVIAVFPEQKLVALEKTPFYGESGGQVGDTGLFIFDNKEFRVVETFISPKGTILHELEEINGLKKDIKVRARIDAAKRQATAAHHTATHLLHKALKEVLGDQVKQAGSYVGPDKLRFDFNSSRALTQEELRRVEQIVNIKIKEKIKIETLQKSYPEALKLGATALFGEKYGERVRVLKVGNYSLELCGGTHAKNTADLLFFKITTECALGAGLRRIEALAGQAAKVFVVYQAKALRDEIEKLIKQYRKLQIEKEALGAERTLETNIFEIDVTELERLSGAIDCQDSNNVNQFLEHLQGRLDWLKERIAKAEKEVREIKDKRLVGESAGMINEAKELAGKKVLLKKVSQVDLPSLRLLADKLLAGLRSGILLLVSSFPDKLLFLVIVTDDLIRQGQSAKKIAEVFGAVVGGKGGGKEAKVEGGGKEPAKIAEGFAAVERLLG